MYVRTDVSICMHVCVCRICMLYVCVHALKRGRLVNVYTLLGLNFRYGGPLTNAFCYFMHLTSWKAAGSHC